jgi:hypothetical protein
VGFEPTISADERPQTYSLDRAETGTGIEKVKRVKTPLEIKHGDKQTQTSNNALNSISITKLMHLFIKGYHHSHLKLYTLKMSVMHN